MTLDVVAYDEGMRADTLGPALMELGMVANGQHLRRVCDRIGHILDAAATSFAAV